jgi:hypothetical protein
LPQASYLTQTFPFETQAFPEIYPIHKSLVVPAISEHSLTLHDLVPVVDPTGNEKIHGTPSDPIVQAASVAYDVQAALATQVVPSVVQTPVVTIHEAQSASEVATLSPHYLNLQLFDEATHVHAPSVPALVHETDVKYESHFPMSTHLAPSVTHLDP